MSRIEGQLAPRRPMGNTILTLQVSIKSTLIAGTVGVVVQALIAGNVLTKVRLGVRCSPAEAPAHLPAAPLLCQSQE